MTLRSAHGGPIWLLLLGRVAGRNCLVSAELGSAAHLRGWDADTGEQLWASRDNALVNHNGYDLALAHAAGDRTLLAAATDRGVYRWDAATGEVAGDHLDLHPCTIWSVASGTLPGGRAILVGAGQDHRVYRWDAVTGELLGPPLTGHGNCVKAVAVTALPSGRLVIVSGDENRVWHRWDAETGEPVGEPLIGGDRSESAYAAASVALPDGRVLLACMDTGGVTQCWDALTGEQIGVPLHAEFVPLSLAAVRVGDRAVLLATDEEEEGVLLWDAATGTRIDTSLTGLTLAAAKAPDGTALVATGTRAGDLAVQPLRLSEDDGS